ncbi:hypothetical protein OG612_45460 (plasmid) [Streptomyces sp. NBC_01527]|uniref:hypothetical protein n=1 Tax=Streptomyces sp. NBC_01527 TaxID=2903894 RepID=UPI002F90E220
MTWTLQPADAIDRSDLHSRYGGRIQGRISPSKQSRNIFLFADPHSPAGHFDAWTGRHVHFTGEGGRNSTSQELKQGNSALSRHSAQGRTLRLFLRMPGPVRYLGEYQLDAQWPYLRADLPTPGAPAISALVFRLLPIDAPKPLGLPTVAPLATELEIVRVPFDVEFRSHGSYPIPPAQEASNDLLRHYATHVSLLGHELARYHLRLPGECTVSPVDLFNHTIHEITIARPGTREAVRSAIGELTDLARAFTPAPSMALLVPEPLRQDLASLCATARIAVIWPNGDHAFERSRSSDLSTDS